MIKIETCELEGEVSETPIFEVKGEYDNESFHCRIELRFNGRIDSSELDYEYLDGTDLGPEGLDVLEELIDEIIETEEFQEAAEIYKEEQDDSFFT